MEIVGTGYVASGPVVSRARRLGLTVVLLGLCCGGGACGEDTRRFEFMVWANLHTSGDAEIWVDGRRMTGRGTTGLKTAFFDSYQHAVDIGVTLETRAEDGTVVDRCVLHAGACGGECEPSRETVSVCVFDDGTIWLNTWDCPCDDETADWFCSGECSVTGPQ